jgi:two-component system chemotaxis response regulator CheB
MARTTVLIVDDSLTMRTIIKSVLRTERDVEVIGEAADAYEAREKIKALNPDVVLLDINMPKMSGLQFLEKIMQLRPMPVVMLAGSTSKGADDTITALSIGAFDCIEKPTSGDYAAGLAHLGETIRSAARYQPKQADESGSTETEEKEAAFISDGSYVGIGSSTGGVEALASVLSKFPVNCPPTVITQHMPQSFLTTFAQRLDRFVPPQVQVATEGCILKAGQVYLAPGGDTHLEIRGRRTFRCHLNPAGLVSGHRPSVDVMFGSMAQSVKEKAIGVILTGMGRDGAKGLLSMRNAGARTIGQDEKSSIVYGMSKVAKEIGAVQKEVPLSYVGQSIISLCNTVSGQKT